MVSPLTMRITLACYYSAAPKDEVGISWGSEPGRDARSWLYTNGLVDRDDDWPKVTEKGEAWINKALSTPLPVCRWEFPDPTPHAFTGGGDE